MRRGVGTRIGYTDFYVYYIRTFRSGTQRLHPQAHVRHAEDDRPDPLAIARLFSAASGRRSARGLQPRARGRVHSGPDDATRPRHERPGDHRTSTEKKYVDTNLRKR